MISPEAKKSLEKQQYIIVGNHSAVKICGWTKNMIRGEGGCYKFKFYGIRSNQCLQMSTSLSCANRCIYCWRDYKSPVSKEWKGDIDDPKTIIEDSLKAQKKLLSGFGGNAKAIPEFLKESKTPKHVALSLTGEPIIYPKINEIINEFHKMRISTFLVTNAQYPEAIKNLQTCTQLYISFDAYDKKLMKEIGKPLFPDYWERFTKSLDYFREKKFRKTVRMTMIKNMNMDNMNGYKELIERADPDFIEIKAYMFVGASRQRLSLANMPRHHEIKEFSEEFVKLLPEYEITSEHAPSRVVLLTKKTFKGKTWIDFDGFFELFEKKSPESINAADYSTGGSIVEDSSIQEIDLD